MKFARHDFARRSVGPLRALGMKTTEHSVNGEKGEEVRESMSERMP